MNATCDRRFTIATPDGAIYKPLDFDALCVVLRDLGRAEVEARRTLLARRLALGAALLQAEQQVPYVRIIEMYERAGISRKVGAACKRKAAHLADDRGRLDQDRVRAVQATIAEKHQPEPGSRLDRLVRLDPDRLSDSAADELVGNRTLRSGQRIPFQQAVGTPSEQLATRASGEQSEVNVDRLAEHRRIPFGGTAPAPSDAARPGGQAGFTGGPGSFARPAGVGGLADATDGVRSAGVTGRQMSLAEHVAELADAAVREIVALRERGDATARAALEAMLEAAKGVALV